MPGNDTRTIILNDASELPAVYSALDASIHAMDFSDCFRNRIFPRLADMERGFFAREAGPDGNPWAHWQFRPAWASDDHPTLHITGALEESLAGGGPGHVESVSANEATYGTSIPYAGIHQYGATITIGIDLVGRGGSPFLPAGTVIEIPARPHVGLTEEMRTEIVQLIGNEYVAQLRGY